MPGVLYHTRQKDPGIGYQFVNHRRHRRQLSLAAVHQDHVGIFESDLRIMGEPAGQDLPHGGKVVLALHRLHAEEPIGSLVGAAVPEDHHAGAYIIVTQVGDIVGLHPLYGSFGHSGKLLQSPYRRHGIRIGSASPEYPSDHHLPGIGLGQLLKVLEFSAHGDLEGHLMS